jgi:hypothetical protein
MIKIKLARRFLTSKQVWVNGLSPRIKQECVLNHKLFRSAETVELRPKEREQQIIGHNALVTFPEENDKMACLMESHYYGGHALMPQQLMPFGNYDHSIPREIFCKVFPHSPVDLSIIENIPHETDDSDIWNMGIDGLSEIKMFDVSEKCDLKHSDSQRKYRIKNPKLKFALFYFEGRNQRRVFEEECKQRQHILFDHELMSRSGHAGEEHGFMGSGRKDIEKKYGRKRDMGRNDREKDPRRFNQNVKSDGEKEWKKGGHHNDRYGGKLDKNFRDDQNSDWEEPDADKFKHDKQSERLRTELKEWA